MNYTFFEQSRHKLARVQRFLDELDVEITKYQKSKPAKIVFDDKREPGLMVIRADILAEPPVSIPLAIGDAIHNMRSALDILACDLVRRAGGTPGTNVMYPFCNDAASLDDVIKKRGLSGLTSAELDAIRDTKPYKGGNDILRSIHDLDIDDKHKLLLTSITTAMAKNVNAYILGGNQVISNLGGIIVRAGVGMFSYPMNSGMYFTMEPELDVDVLLDHCPAQGNVTTQLRAMLDTATAVLDAFN